MPKEKVTKPYVNNKEFLEHMIKYRNNVLEAENSGRERPR